jgi:multidrug efflux pump subunit AcrA (membrane-fusion protein)
MNGSDVVFIRKSQTAFETRPVRTGKTLDDVTEIQSGLRQGEGVVSTSSFHLKSVALSGQIGEEE